MFYTALIFGLLSSFHCIGMCGPIAMMLPVDHNKTSKRVLQIITYHLGRISAYATIGFVFGLVGKGFFMAGIQQQLSIGIGIAMIAIVLIPAKLFSKYNFSKPAFKFIASIKSTLGVQFKNRSYKSLFTIGLLNGFLPCGMVYVSLFGAIAMQHAGWGAVYMMLFGLGTIPLMSSIVLLQGFITIRMRNRLQGIIPYVAITMGCFFILRGLGLGIPYVSPSTMSLFIQSNATCH